MVLLIINMKNSVYSAPRPQNILHDSVNINENKLNNSESNLTADEFSYSDDYLSNDAIISNMRSKIDSEEDSGFEGYMFDENKCKVIDDRILCGYNKNKNQDNEEGTVDIGNDCFIRNDRIECGYLQQPKQKPADLRWKTISPITNIVTEQTYKSEESETPISVSVSVTPETTITDTYAPSKINLLAHSTTTDQTGILSDITITRKLVNDKSHSLSVDLTVNKSETKTLSSTAFPDIKENSTTEKPVTFVLENNLDLRNQSKTASNKGEIIRIRKQRNTDKISSKFLKSFLRNPKTILNSRMPTVYSRKTNIRKEVFRKDSDKSMTKTACVEDKDRIVCYEYNSI